MSPPIGCGTEGQGYWVLNRNTSFHVLLPYINFPMDRRMTTTSQIVNGCSKVTQNRINTPVILARCMNLTGEFARIDMPYNIKEKQIRTMLVFLTLSFWIQCCIGAVQISCMPKYNSKIKAVQYHIANPILLPYNRGFIPALMSEPLYGPAI